jgi:ArsR family transcriptional regulator
MNSGIQARLRAHAGVFKALAHPSRLLIVERLARRERCVCELTGMIGADISTVSRHLSVLRTAGIVAADKRGLQVYYRLTMPCVLGFIECVGRTVEAQAKRHSKIVHVHCSIPERRGTK